MAETVRKNKRNPEGGRNMGNTYHMDNLARNNSLAEEKRQKRYEKIVERNRRANRQNEQAVSHINAGVDFLSMLFIAAAIICVAFFGARYLITSARTAELGRNLKEAKVTLDDMKKGNDAAYSNVDASVDMGEVYEKAVGEYGMVFPDENQVVMYDYHEEGYVRQYEAIPND